MTAKNKYNIKVCFKLLSKNSCQYSLIFLWRHYCRIKALAIKRFNEQIKFSWDINKILWEEYPPLNWMLGDKLGVGINQSVYVCVCVFISCVGMEKDVGVRRWPSDGSVQWAGRRIGDSHPRRCCWACEPPPHNPYERRAPRSLDHRYTPWYFRRSPEPEEEFHCVDSSNEELRSLLQRQKLELEALQRRHREEVEALCRHLSGSHPTTYPPGPYGYSSNGGGGHGSLEGYCTAPQSPEGGGSSRVGSPLHMHPLYEDKP